MTTKRLIVGLADNDQGADEQITYVLDTSNFPSAPPNAGAVTVKVYSLPDLTDVTTSVTSGSVSVSGDNITFPTVKSLTAGTVYRIEVKWTGSDGDVYEAYGILKAER